MMGSKSLQPLGAGEQFCGNLWENSVLLWVLH